MPAFTLRAEHFPLKVESALKFDYQRFFQRAFLVAAVLHYVAIGAYWGVVMIQEANKDYRVRIIKYADLAPPPALTDAPETPDVEVETKAAPVIGIPDPVDDTEVSAEMTIATQQEMSQNVAPVITGDETKIVIEAPKQKNILVEKEVLPEPDEFIAYEEPPTRVVFTPPVYPEIARKAGVEGTVVLHVLVDKEGNIRNVRVIKGLGAGLDEAAIESAKNSKWTPAIQNHRPVAVWVSLPIRFKLR